MVWVGTDLKDDLNPTPLPLTGTPSTRAGCSKAPFNLPLNTSRERASTASLGNLFQCLTTLTVKNFFLISSLKLHAFSLKPLALVLSLHVLVKGPFLTEKSLFNRTYLWFCALFHHKVISSFINAFL